jgi:hypothetical protein
LAALVVALRSLALICGGHRAVALENLALCQQPSRSSFRRTGIPRESDVTAYVSQISLLEELLDLNDRDPSCLRYWLL